MLLEADHTAIGLSIVSLDRHAQSHLVSSARTPVHVQIKFFRRDGALIAQISLPFRGTTQVAFARCGGAVDIAGIQITSNSHSGIAIDNIVFGLPEVDESPRPAISIGQTQIEADPELNPLGVKPCSFNIS